MKKKLTIATSMLFLILTIIVVKIFFTYKGSKFVLTGAIKQEKTDEEIFKPELENETFITITNLDLIPKGTKIGYYTKEGDDYKYSIYSVKEYSNIRKNENNSIVGAEIKNMISAFFNDNKTYISNINKQVSVYIYYKNKLITRFKKSLSDIDMDRKTVSKDFIVTFEVPKQEIAKIKSTGISLTDKDIHVKIQGCCLYRQIKNF